MDCHIKGGKELRCLFVQQKNALKEGVLTLSRPDVYQYNNEQHEEYEGIYKGYRKSYGFVIMPDDEDMCIAEQNKGHCYA